MKIDGNLHLSNATIVRIYVEIITRILDVHSSQSQKQFQCRQRYIQIRFPRGNQSMTNQISSTNEQRMSIIYENMKSVK